MSIAFIGDVHGHMGDLNALLRGLPPEVEHVIQVGDYGIRWPGLEDAAVDPIRRVDFIDGNHECYPLLRPHMQAPGPVEVAPNSWYHPRGSVAVIDGYRIGFLGGAESIDKAYRTAEVSWWADESIRYGDLMRLDAEVKAMGGIDLLVTHTPPDVIVAMMLAPNASKNDPRYNRSARAVQEVWGGLNKPPVICGHLHESFHAFGVRVLAINEVAIMPAKEIAAIV